MESQSEQLPPVRVGIMRPKILDHATTFRVMAYMARHFNVELFFFITKDVDFENKTANALFLDGDKKIRQKIPLPKIIDNHPLVFSGEYGKKVLQLANNCYFMRPLSKLRDGKAITKQKVYDFLSQDGRYKEFLIETHVVKNIHHFLTLFEENHREVILKPAVGSEGNGVAKITFENDQYVVNLDSKRNFFRTLEDFSAFYKESFMKRTYLLQPYVASRTRQGNPFDIRIHARRGAEGKFKIFPYPRIGDAKGVVSNISAGGYTESIKIFLRSEFGKDGNELYRRLMDLGRAFPDYYQTFFNNTLYNVGIDVGIQRHGNSYELKIFEVNIRYLGTKCLPIDAAITTLEYYQYLGQKLRDGSLFLSL